ncbi:DUF488 family protein [Terriglobus saanensis]|uniref:Uncharacterized protein n=1 Tax=Terriglobus saanensis (strain ATCC BAA-1853 / DSM 23119 / SP1PR4) TaxID=401053 RepID=E8V4J8_TERSS|nr:DUF488 domain-containing protein [Terriglobus saanensis]ADV84822.1 hypothetical protein AciPR4_4074 [Terriglobus saanensis SP1PR4]
MLVFTVGHSTRTIEEFVGMLQTHGVQSVVDTRTVPRSRHNPQFAQEALSASLQAAGLRYVWMGKELGGFRKPVPDSINNAWRNDSFRGYADYMQTAAFTEALEKLIALASEERVAVMCAEAVPWRCHRSLTADALVARGIEVHEIVSAAKTSLHVLSKMAHVEGDRVTYPLSGRLEFP